MGGCPPPPYAPSFLVEREPAESPPERGGDGAEVQQSGLDVINHLLGQVGRFGKVGILEPEEIQAGLVAGGEFGVGELPPLPRTRRLTPPGCS